MDALSHRLTALVALSFLGVALVQTWPLALHASTDITGLAGGDAGVYLWNIWHFRHRILDLGASPFLTTGILAAGETTNLALHNYSVFADLVAMPLQSFASVVTSFNVVYVLNVALAGLGMFLLAHRVTGRVAEAWLAGLMFAWAPFLVARGASHFSLAAAAPLPFFLYWLDRAWSDGRARDAAAAGATVAWAFYCDPYYAVYTAMLCGVYVANRFLNCERVEGTRRTHRTVRIIDSMMAAILVVAVGLVIATRTLYTPMLLLAVLLLARVTLRWRVRVSWPPLPPRVVRLGVTLAASAAILLAPELHALALMTTNDQLVSVPVLWRSSAPGVDALAFLIPNPNHVIAPSFVRSWLAGQPGGFDENVASLSYVAMAVVVVAWRRAGLKPVGLWLAVTLGFASIALGPFLKVAGARTFFPTPWALGRYLPIIGEARMPQRFSVLVFLGLTVLFAAGLVAIGRRWPDRRRAVLAVVGLALAIELWPAPRQLFAADVPGVFHVVASDARPLRILELPFGIRDGLSSLGNFSASSQFYQTLHTKDLIGGYVSRLDEGTKRAYRNEPVTRALIEFAEERVPSAELLAAAIAAGPAFIDRTKLGYVVIEGGRVTPVEREFALAALGLERVDAPAETGARELYVTPLAR
jgi:hypothetical protein